MVFDENLQSKDYPGAATVIGNLSARPSKQSIHNYYMAAY